MRGEFKPLRRRAATAWLALSCLALSACAPPKLTPLKSPFPPTSRWERTLDGASSGPLVSDGTAVFTAASDGTVSAWDAATGAPLWSRKVGGAARLAVRPGLLVCAESSGIVWGLETSDGGARYKTTTGVTGVSTLRVDGNRVFLGGSAGFAALIASTGELRFDLPATQVRDLDVAGEWLAAIEDGQLVERARETGLVRFKLASPEGEFGAPALFPDGRVVVGSGMRLVRSVSSKGRFGWRFKVGARVKDRPLDFGDGRRVGILSYEGVFYEVSLKGGDMRRRAPLASRPFGPATLVSGRIFAPIFDDDLVSIDSRTLKVLGRTRFGGSYLHAPVLAGDRMIAEVAGPRRLVALGLVPLP